MSLPPPEADAVKRVLFELIDLPSAEQLRRIELMRQEWPAMAERVEPLLGDALRTATGLNAPARWAAELLEQGWPERLGPWRVLRELGRGGMGVVLLAERADGAFAKQVAVKVLPPVFAGADGVSRLAAEAQALARLDHPHIARLLDAGIDRGCAYLAMEFVDGEALPLHAQRRRLDAAARVRLVLELCSAVQFAHAQLLVHRDIKPANVLVDREGRVRLLDFGIAKVLGNDEATHTQRAACTPAYASPEQLLGQPVTVASDVFSLGVLLYELLCGRRPFDQPGRLLASEATPDSASTLSQLRAVLERDPDPAALREAGVPTDLRATVLKALEKTPERRYASVEALAGDLRAWLEGRPVTAREPSAAYRAQRFIGRHRWAVGGAAVATVAVLGFAAWAVVNAREADAERAVAQRRLEAVRAIANKVVYDYNRALEPVPGTLEVRRTLVADALTYLDALGREAAGDTALLADVAQGFEAVGDVQGRGVTGANLGDMAGAQKSYERALALRETACAQGWVRPVGATADAAAASVPATAPPPALATTPARSACAALAGVRLRLGDNAFSQGRMPDALPHFDAALKAAEQARAAAADDPGLQREAEDARFEAVQRLAGLSTRQTGEAYARGLALAQTQLAAAQALVALAPTLKSYENLRVAQDFLAARLLADGRPDAALPAVREAIATARRLQAMRPSRDAVIYLTASLSRLAEIQAHRRDAPGARDEARAAVRESVDLLWALHRAEPEDRHLRARLANIGRRFAEVNNLLGDAESLAINARELPQLLAVSAVFTPADGPFYAQHQYLLREQAQTLLLQGQPKAALVPLAALPPNLPPNPRAAADLAEAFLLRAQAQHGSGDTAGAWATLLPALATLQGQVQATPTLVPARARLAWALQLAARWAEAQPAQAPVGSDPAAWRREAQAHTRALTEAGQLTPWWQAALAVR